MALSDPWVYQYRATVMSVVDGDTVHLNIDLGLEQSRLLTVRVLGINAPEVKTPEGKAARDWARLYLPVGSALMLTTIKDRTEKYGRYLGVLALPDGTDYAQAAMDGGHAVAWDGKGTRP